MLILTRKKNETIMIGNEIEITLLSIDGDQVKIGIKAPKEVEIYRQEIYQAIQEENKEAVKQAVSLDHLKNLVNKKNI